MKIEFWFCRCVLQGVYRLAVNMANAGMKEKEDVRATNYGPRVSLRYFFFRFKEQDGSAVSNKFDYRALVSSVGPLRRSLEGIREIVL